MSMAVNRLFRHSDVNVGNRREERIQRLNGENRKKATIRKNRHYCGVDNRFNERVVTIMMSLHSRQLKATTRNVAASKFGREPSKFGSGGNTIIVTMHWIRTRPDILRLQRKMTSTSPPLTKWARPCQSL